MDFSDLTHGLSIVEPWDLTFYRQIFLHLCEQCMFYTDYDPAQY